MTKVLTVTEVFGPTGITKLSRSTGYELVREGLFPVGHVMANGRRGWIDAEVHEWIARWADAHPAVQRSGNPVKRDSEAA